MSALSRRQLAIVAGTAVAIIGLLIMTLVVWPDDDESVAAEDERPTTTAAPVETTTSTSTPPTPPTTLATDTTAPELPSTTATRTELPTTAPAPTSTRPPAPPTSSPSPPYRSTIDTVTAAQLGSSYTPGIGCAEPAALRAVNLIHWGYDGAVHDGRIIVNAAEADDVAAVFGELYVARFPIERVEPVDVYDSDDQASMRANNTSGYNCRTVAGSSKLSNHAFGRAVDLNPLHNPYVKGDTVDPPEGAPWADRSNRRQGMIYGGDAAVTAFGARGWGWGGTWNNPDYQHFDTR